MDSFDPIYYNLGLELYGNMPLIEPLETKEMKKIEDFVIVLDTSMSCNGSLIRRFLEETYSVLSESESFFRKIQVHIIQCDEKIQDDQVIHDQREMEAYLQDFTIRGFGGTDFRPAFAYVEPEVKEEPVQVIEEEEPTEEEKIPFTIAGNGEVEDNITDDSSKEFFTVKTKGGNTFFLVIDRARNSENVYMLSMIDEYDLQEFLTDEERNGKEEEEPAVVLPETKPEPEPDVEIEEPEQDDGKLTKILAIVFVLGVGGAGAFFYFYIYKPKQSEPEVSKENLEYEALPTKNEDEQDAETEE